MYTLLLLVVASSLLLLLLPPAVRCARPQSVPRTEHRPDQCWTGVKHRIETAMRRAFADDAAQSLADYETLRSDNTAGADERQRALERSVGKALWRSLQTLNVENAEHAMCDRVRARIADPCTSVHYDRARQKCVTTTQLTQRCIRLRARRGLRFV